jgi:peptidoglycan/xylan/chitin deacetylase (PgdA/CDA1 family)
MHVPVLTYHSINIVGNDYANNDHIALAEDLRVIHRKGWRIVPLARVVDVLLGEAPESEVENTLAITFDDGAWFDWYDLDHPICGPQRGFAGILRDFTTETGAPAHATSFVIVSPDARATLDRTCLIGRGWWDDTWWREAQRENLIAIENHSWDHNHISLPRTARLDPRKGTFYTIDSHADADAEIRQAADWLDAHLPSHRTSLFAYPYGETNNYLIDEYLPNHIREHRLRAAFGTAPQPIDFGSPRWKLPRYVYGHHWREPARLERLLTE